MIADRPTLLISDDDRDLRESLGAVFSHRGFETLFAGDGQEAWDVVRGQQVHLVLIDFHMPRMTGLQAMQLMKQHRSELPVILMSAELTDAICAQAADAWAIHKKPVNIQQIRHDVSRALKSIYHWTTESAG